MLIKNMGPMGPRALWAPGALGPTPFRLIAVLPIGSYPVVCASEKVEASELVLRCSGC